jgi:DNA-directed RNA polymerase subunit RPC12/RpoP
MIKKNPLDKRDEFQVTCIWCGKKIRADQHEDSTGECLQCFYRILSENLLSQPRTFAGEFVSER